jgi:simple sugar transport system ATP-binding protein
MEAMAEYLLSMARVSKAFSGVQALDNVELFIKPGRVMCLAGENGCGKSTLVKIISGVYTRDSGEVCFEDKNLASIIPARAVALGIQVIYQDLSIFPNLTVMENLSLNTELSEKRKIISWKRMRGLAKKALATIGQDIPLSAKMGDLSVADKQLVAICRALLHNAKLIIMDEPTTALTKKEVDALFKTVVRLKESGIAILFISHKLEEIFEIADDVTILRNGKNVYTGTTQELDHRKFAYYMTGRDLTDARFQPGKISPEPVLEAKGLTLKDKYNDISFCLRKGEILGITGLLGSGRTELALSLFGVLKPTDGQVLLSGKEIHLHSPIAAQRHHIGYVPEDRLTEGLFLNQPIAENITVSSMDRLSNKLSLISREAILKEADKWVKKLSIATNDARKAASTLSGGNQQKIVLAKWLSNDLDVLILNAPTVGVDVGSKADLHQLFHGLARAGMAIIIISDDLIEVAGNCNRVLVMKDGGIVGHLEDAGITEQAILQIIR